MYDEQSTADREFPNASRGYRYDWTSAEAVSMAVVEAVAEFNGVDRVALDALYDTVDPDALDALFSARGSRSAGAVRRVDFLFNGTDVTVFASGELVLRPADEATET